MLSVFELYMSQIKHKVFKINFQDLRHFVRFKNRFTRY